MIVTSEELLFQIRLLADRAVFQCEDALSEPLTDDADESAGDCPQARENLTRSASAAKLLQQYLEHNFEFENGFAEPKEANNAAHT